MTQEALAEKLNVSRQTISKWEMDVANPEMDKALEICKIKEQPAHKYAAIHVDRPFENPFVIIPGAYQTLEDFMRTNGLVQSAEGVIPCFETDGESMDIYIACR